MNPSLPQPLLGPAIEGRAGLPMSPDKRGGKATPAPPAAWASLDRAHRLGQWRKVGFPEGGGARILPYRSQGHGWTASFFFFWESGFARDPKNELELEKEHWSCHSSGRRPGQNMVDARHHPPAAIQISATGCAVRCVLSGPLISLARTARPQCTPLQ